MIQKMFEKMLLKAFNRFNEQIGKYLESNTEILREHNKELSEIKKVFKIEGMNTWSTAGARIESYETIVDQIKKDYFTKEYINEDATNTKNIYVIERGCMTTHLYKEGNESDEVKDINGKKYLFKSGLCET